VSFASYAKLFRFPIRGDRISLKGSFEPTLVPTETKEKYRKKKLLFERLYQWWSDLDLNMCCVCFISLYAPIYFGKYSGGHGGHCTTHILMYAHTNLIFSARWECILCVRTNVVNVSLHLSSVIRNWHVSLKYFPKARRTCRAFKSAFLTSKTRFYNKLYGSKAM